MPIGISSEVNANGYISMTNLNTVKKERKNKGKNLLKFPTDYCVIDIETTGFDTYFDSIIEISALRIRNGVVCDTFSTLIQPKAYCIVDERNIHDCFDSILLNGKNIYYVDSFITELTGITNQMLQNAPSFQSIQENFIKFISSDILVGHNVNFDINFLYDNLEESGIVLSNNFVDTCRLSKRILPDLNNHKLSTLSKHFKLDDSGAHRAEKDCTLTFEILKSLMDTAIELFGDYDACTQAIQPKSFSESQMIKEITTTKTEFDEDHPFYGKEFVFTGKLDHMARKDAMQLVVDFGGKCGGNVTKRTNFLVLGNNDYCSTIKDGKSAKQKKAEEYKLKGLDIEILSESVFYDMLEE